jgi:hypothetical protein
VVAALSLAVLAPARVAALWWRPTPPAITSGALARAIPRHSTVVALPFWNYLDDGLVAQSDSDFSYGLVDRWLQTVPAPYLGLADWSPAREWQLTPTQGVTLEHKLCALGIGYAVVWPHDWHSNLLLWVLHLRPVRADGVLVYRMPRCRGPRLRRAGLVRGHSASARAVTSRRE